MKKTLCIVMLLAMVFALCACGHTATTTDNFISVMESKGFIVEPMEDAPDGGEGYIAYTNDFDFVVMFYRLTSAEQANNAYQNDVAILDTMGGTSTSVNAGSFGCTTRNADGVFYITSHVDNTYMYGKTSSDQASAMKELFEFFDYK